MNTQLFRYLIEIERTRSITQAAENLFMGQPNLSRAVKELEENLGFAVFERTSKGVAPTEKGTEFLMYARNIITQLDNIGRLSDAVTKNLQGLSVSVPRASYISKALARFVLSINQELPIDINIKETNAMQSIADVSEGKHNFAIIRYRMLNESYFRDYLYDKKLLSETIWEFERVILTSGNNKYLKDGVLNGSDMPNCIELVHGDTIVPYHKQGIKSVNSSKNKTIRLYERGNQFELLSSIPISYIWTSPVPNDYLKKYNLIMARSDKKGRIYRDVLIHPKEYKFTSLDRKFIDYIYEEKNKLSVKE